MISSELPDEELSDSEDDLSLADTVTEVISEIASVYNVMQLTASELKTQWILGLSWGSQTLKSQGYNKESALLSDFCELVRNRTMDDWTVKFFSNDVQRAVNVLAKISVSSLQENRKLDDPFSFFFLCGAPYLEHLAKKGGVPNDIASTNLPSDIDFDESDNSEMPGEIRETITHLIASGNFQSIGTCVVPKCKEPEKHIRAHSISKSKFLEPFASNNRLWKIAYPLPPKMERLHWVNTSPGDASRFSGLCAKHDSVFNPLDEVEPDKCLSSPELLSLMALRSALHGYYQRLDTDYRRPVLGWYSIFLTGTPIKGLRHGLTNWIRNIPYEINRNELLKLCNIYWDIVSQQQWNDIEHHILQFNGVSPRVIISGIGAHFTQQGLQTPITVNIFPTTSGMVAVISHLKKGAKRIHSRMEWLKRQSPSEHKRILTWMGMHHWHNAYFTEEYYNFLNCQQKENVINMALFYSWLPQVFYNNENPKFLSAPIYNKINFSFFG